MHRYTEQDPIENEEVAALRAEYGGGDIERIDLDIDLPLFEMRATKSADRRAEVVFAIQGPGSGTLVHRKAYWDEGVYRLPSGGIYPDEEVIVALNRELREETGLVADETRFLGVQDCHMHYDGQTVRFVSFIFHVARSTGELIPEEREQIVEFQEVSPEGLAAIAARLRYLPAPHNGWGRWRALAHDLVHRYLVTGHQSTTASSGRHVPR